jgi:uncharacterized membrane protein YgaE (UPF0421/DUF939 family)
MEANMKDFLIGVGVGFALGAVMIKSNKDFSKAVDKTKKMVEEKVEMGKDFVEENIKKPKKQPKQPTKKQSN